MNTVADFISRYLESQGAAMLDTVVLFSITVGISITLLLMLGIYTWRVVNNPVRRRVLQASGSMDNPLSRARRIDQSLGPIKVFIVPRHGKELSAIRARLIYAGFRGEENVTAYYALKLVFLVTCVGLSSAVAFSLPDASAAAIIACMLLGCCVGIVLPSLCLDRRIEARRSEIVNGFPDVLDLIVACTEAGLGLNDAIQRVSRETSLMFPVLSSELGLVNSQIRAGVDRIDALQGFAQRTGIEEVKSFVSMVNQSVRFGTSIADTLRIFSEEFRDRRMQRAEEQAAKVGTKLIFPLVLCIFPSFFVITIGPAVMSIAKVFSQIG